MWTHWSVFLSKWLSCFRPLKRDTNSLSHRLHPEHCEAYGALVLRSLCLRNRYPLISERLEEIRQFQSLECLDLYGCRLGLQRLTAPVRVMKKGLENLQLLELCDECVFERILQKDENGVLRNTSEGVWTLIDCKTEGWAEQVINQWEITASEVPKKDCKPRTNALRFYGREKFVRETLNSWSGTSDITKKDKVVVIHFHRIDLCGSSLTAEHNTHSSTVAAVQKGKKRRLSTEEEQSSAPLSKCQSLSAEDLLNSY